MRILISLKICGCWTKLISTETDMLISRTVAIGHNTILVFSINVLYRAPRSLYVSAQWVIGNFRLHFMDTINEVLQPKTLLLQASGKVQAKSINQQERSRRIIFRCISRNIVINSFLSLAYVFHSHSCTLKFQQNGETIYAPRVSMAPVGHLFGNHVHFQERVTLRAHLVPPTYQ